MNMRNVYLIARYTIRALLSKKVLLGGVLLFAVFASVIVLAGHFRVEEQVKIMKDVGITFFSFCAFLCVLVCVPVVHAPDRAANEDPLLLVRPVSRAAILAGRFCGIALVMALAIVFGSIVFMALLWARFSVVPLTMIPVLYLLFLKYCVFLCVMFLLATCCQTLVAYFSAIMLFLLSHGLAFYHGHEHCHAGCAEHCTEHGAPLLAKVVRVLLPRFDLFSHLDAITFDTVIPLSYCASVTAYALVYGGCLFLLTMYAFSRREC